LSLTFTTSSKCDKGQAVHCKCIALNSHNMQVLSALWVLFSQVALCIVLSPVSVHVVYVLSSHDEMLFYLLGFDCTNHWANTEVKPRPSWEMPPCNFHSDKLTTCILASVGPLCSLLLHHASELMSYCQPNCRNNCPMLQWASYRAIALNPWNSTGVFSMHMSCWVCSSLWIGLGANHSRWQNV